MLKLPIHSVLPDLLAALREAPRAFLVAPPGAGKTTAVAPALLNEARCAGKCCCSFPDASPRAPPPSSWLARQVNCPAATFGYATRLDSKVGKQTRVMSLTHGVFLARIQADPELAGVSALLFDEVHERSLDNDLALALALDAAAALRPDLRLVAMSATLDSDRFARLLGNPPRIESEGKSYPLTISHVGRDPVARIEPQMAAAVRRALADHTGSLLAFLPGVAEIERTATALGELPPDIVLHRLHGGIDPPAQRAALAPPTPGTRKLVLATWIAETSLTLDDVASSSIAASHAARATTEGRTHPPGYRARQPRRDHPARRPRRAPIAGRRDPAVGGSRERRAPRARPARNPRRRSASAMLTCLLWGKATSRACRGSTRRRPPPSPKPATD